jgi:hypothetical protein
MQNHLFKFSFLIFRRMILGIVFSAIVVLSMIMISTFLGDFFSFIIGTICGVSIYFALIYDSCWHQGFIDPGKEKLGRYKKMTEKGLVAGIFASIPFLILGILAFILYYTSSTSNILFIIYKILNFPYFFLTKQIFMVYPAASLIFLIFVPCICSIAYCLGYNNETLSGKIMYKKSAK